MQKPFWPAFEVLEAYGGLLEVFGSLSDVTEACLRLVEAYWRLAEGIGGLWRHIRCRWNPVDTVSGVDRARILPMGCGTR